MIDRILQLIRRALARWVNRLFALARSPLRALLIAGIGVVGTLTLGLLYHAISDTGDRAAQTTRLIAAYNKNWMIGLAFFSAVAAGYTYWALQVIAEDSPQTVRRRLESFSEVAFVGAVSWIIIALLLWNFGLFFRASDVS